MAVASGLMASDRRAEMFGDLRSSSRSNVGVPLLLMVLLGLMILPVPAFILDILFSFNIALSLVVLLVAVYTLRPLDFAAFPTILLVATLLRLALNVASTRVVLLHGHNGGDAAGKVIEAFGHVVIGGNYAVGIIVFMILMIINFVVVTKGAGRISEVSARFTLDAMPGKQMAIDADLNAGVIDQDEAKLRREEVSMGADFYGSMDGASKFVRGDAVAGIMILFLNLIGGLLIGMLQHNLAFADALEKYTLLTIGDGLVAQIPSLLLSTAAAIIVTRVNSAQDMREQVFSQLFAAPKALGVSAVTLGVMGLIPGMPHVSFLALALLAGGGAFMIYRRGMLPEIITAAESGPLAHLKPLTRTADAGGHNGGLPAPLASQNDSAEVSWDDVGTVDPVGLEVGYRLIPMVDQQQNGELLARIRGVRKKLSRELGFLIPSVHIRDNLDLNPSAYRITLMGVNMAQGEVYPDRDMAINPGQVFGRVEGVVTRDPAFGLEAVWIERDRRDAAQAFGYTVVDCSTVIATHLNQVLQKHAAELLGHEEVQHMLDKLAKTAPKLADELVPGAVSLNVLLKVLQKLLGEQVPVSDLRSIGEAIAAAALQSKDAEFLTSAVRQALARIIVQNLYGNADNLALVTLDPQLEQLLIKSVQQAQKQQADVQALLEPRMVEKLQQSMQMAADRQLAAGKPAVFLVSAAIRSVLVQIGRYCSVDVHVLSYDEIPRNKQITVESTIAV